MVRALRLRIAWTEGVPSLAISSSGLVRTKKGSSKMLPGPTSPDSAENRIVGSCCTVCSTPLPMISFTDLQEHCRSNPSMEASCENLAALESPSHACKRRYVPRSRQVRSCRVDSIRAGLHEYTPVCTPVSSHCEQWRIINSHCPLSSCPVAA